MLIQAGSEIAFHFPQPTTTLLMLYLHPSLAPSVRKPERLEVEPSVKISDYIDLYGNRCGRAFVPAGRVVFRHDVIVENDGQPEKQSWGACQHPVQDLPDDTLLFLLGSRYCEVDSELKDHRLETVRHHAGGMARGAIRLQLRPPAYPFRLSAGTCESDRASKSFANGPGSAGISCTWPSPSADA